MKLRTFSQNQTEIAIGDTTILFSYHVPVAISAFSSAHGCLTVTKTNKFWSKTTSRHINQFVEREVCSDPVKVEEASQDWLDNFASEVK